MKRTSVAFLSALLTVLCLTPASAGAKTIYMQGLIDGGGQVQFTVYATVKKVNGKKKVIPRRVYDFEFAILPVSCQPDDTFLTFSANNPVKIANGAFHRVFADGTGGFGAKVLRKPLRFAGNVNRHDLDLPSSMGPGQQNCTTNGPRSWKASECDRGFNDKPGIPNCRGGS